MKQTMNQPSPKEVQKMVKDFNRRVKVGEDVFYYPVLSKNRPPETPKRLKVKHEAWILGGHTAVVYLEGAGTVAVTHCFPVKDNVLFNEEKPKQQLLFKIA
jgi:hypothetical protein